VFFSWLRRLRRRKILARPFPPAWHGYLQRNVAHYRYLTAAEQARLRDDLRVFIAEKHWEGCGGLVITDEIRVTVAAQACLLVLGMEHNVYDRVRSILVYPHGFRDTHERAGPLGVVDGTGTAVLGQSWYRGPVILSWSDARDNSRHPRRGHNLVFHEFAHQLDMLDGVINGTPPLGSRQEYDRWKEVMTAEYRRLVSESTHGRATLLDEYGTTNEGEFFAVATECFFDLPEEMRRRHPRLYDLLRDYYRQDPAERFVRRQKVLDSTPELGGETVL
jgi:Mlc titration factor MtfA (ptsG expression regulator)